MIIVTTTTRGSETSTQAEEDAESDHSSISDIEIKDEGKDLISELSSLPSEQTSVQHVMFLCLHCETHNAAGVNGSFICRRVLR
jgi:hypothetical protein